MSLDFPVNPQPNDEYSFGDKTWVYTGKGWRLKSEAFILANKAVNANSEVFTANGSTFTFTLSSTDFIGKVNNSIVTVDGLTQIPGVQYTAGGNTINFSTPPVANSLIEVRLFELVDANSVITIQEKITEFVPGNSFFQQASDTANAAAESAAQSVALIASSLEAANTTLNVALESSNNTLNIALESSNNTLNTALFVLDAANSTINLANEVLDTANGVLDEANNTLNVALQVLDQNADFTNITISTGTFGNAGFIPVVTVEANGRISDISTVALEVTENAQFTTIGVGTTPDTANTGSIRATGDITAFFSDERLKDVIGPIPNALDKVMQLTGVLFTNNDTAAEHGYTDKSEQVGLLAGQVKLILPQIVTRAPFDITQDENGNDISKTGNDYLTVRYEKLIPLLVEAIKEQQIIIDDLRKRL
jgi:hypothetical protein